jgi:hypothetical protein
MTRSVIRLNTWKKKGVGADRLSPIRKSAKPAELVRPGTIMEERRSKWNPIGRDRSRRGWSRHEWKPRCASHNARWEPMSTGMPSRLGEYDSVGDREREKPSTLILEASATTDQRKTEEMAGDDEELDPDGHHSIHTTIRRHTTRH